MLIAAVILQKGASNRLFKATFQTNGREECVYNLYNQNKVVSGVFR